MALRPPLAVVRRSAYLAGMIRHATLAVALALAPVAGGAHPHMFVDADLRLEIDVEGRITAIEVTWTYDDFSTLLILEDRGLDPDGDAVLTDAELEELRGFDLEIWPEDYEGDVYLRNGERTAEIGLPKATGIAVENAKIVASHRREVVPFPAEGTVIETYDPTFFVAFTLKSVHLPERCEAPIDPVDVEEAGRKVQELVGEVNEMTFEVLEVGHLYADKARITCAASS
jgi:polyphosphate kinase